ncbi:hypothetical protein [Microbispora triticiradicis]|nr:MULTISPECIES: hypothetical protein [Microbispora]MBO4271768.1 hypothetical protein [Microbispora triticiradicis]
MFALVKRMACALGRGFVRLGRYWAAQFGVPGAVLWSPEPDPVREMDEAEHWDWSIPYLWYEASQH